MILVYVKVTQDRNRHSFDHDKKFIVVKEIHNSYSTQKIYICNKNISKRS